MTEHTWQVRVYYEDTDTMGVVYNANYFKYLERARTEWLRALGYEQDALLRDQQLFFAVRSLNIDYVAPARFNDLLQVGSALTGIGRASLAFAQKISHPQGAQLCKAAVKIVAVDARTFRPRALPPELLRAFECCIN